MNENFLNFEEAVKKLGFDPGYLKLEHFLSGANNNVFGLKYNNITWAISISFPKTKNISKDKLRKFIRLQKICSYLTDRFKNGVEINQKTKFIFDGNCFLCEPNSTKKFIKKLSKNQKFKVSEQSYNYIGPFMVK